MLKGGGKLGKRVLEYDFIVCKCEYQNFPWLNCVDLMCSITLQSWDMNAVEMHVGSIVGLIRPFSNASKCLPVDMKMQWGLNILS